MSPTTLRSWDQRYGIGPVARQEGRHRRWTASDIAVLEEMCRLTASGVPPAEAARAARADGPTGPSAERTSPLPAAEHDRLSPGDVRRAARGLARAAVRLDSAALERLLGSAIAEHGLVTAWEDVLVPTLHAVGRRWETSGDRYVEVEHLLSWHIATALRRAPRPP
ncbi:hypothetical protein GCM10010272_15780 [Streptomyces lateritius]|nr:hypothetical protein GCM10010272_15780 [Streptomyces lateritius]